MTIETIENMPFGWTDFEPEPDTTGDGSGDPDKYILTIYEAGGEIATIVHRTCHGRFPLDGEVAERKRLNAQRIVAALTDPLTAGEDRP